MEVAVTGQNARVTARAANLLAQEVVAGLVRQFSRALQVA